MPVIQVQYVSCRKDRLGSLATGNCSNAETTFYMKPELNVFPKPMLLLRYESSTLILFKELSSTIFQSRESVSEASVTPVQISALCNI